ncbi:TPA: hypothetical protein J1Y47_002230 [Escherichia coli]|nr:hypothetical protein [Escherichia coli]
MPSLEELAEQHSSQLSSVLKSAVETISSDQEITFRLYVRQVLPLDGFVYWVNAEIISCDELCRLNIESAGNGPYSYYKYPAVGVPVLAVYQGAAAGDKAIKIGLGDIVPGSRLGPVTITCSINDAGSYVSTPRVSAGGAGAFSFPGRYQALSGFSNSYGDEGRICLFVRIE